MFPSPGPDDRAREPRSGGGRPAAATSRVSGERAGGPQRPGSGRPDAPAGRRGARRGEGAENPWDADPAEESRGRGGGRGLERRPSTDEDARPRRRRPAPEPDPEEDLDIPEVPVRRLLSLTIAAFALVLAAVLVLGAQANRSGFSVVIFGAQLLFVVAWTAASRPPAPFIVAGVGLVAAAAADISVNLPVEPTLAPLGYVIAGAFVLAVIGQLVRRHSRAGLTESLGVSMTIVVGVAAFAALIVLSRQKAGTQVLDAGLIAAGIALASARMCDIFVPSPRLAPQVPRGAVGVVVGAMLGTAAAAVVGSYIDGLSPVGGAAAGMAAALVAVVVDLGTGYAEAGRRLEGEVPFMWLARHMQGPLAAFALAAPASYVVGVILN
ncbi:hypothetical protein [Luedemannella flava]|uniref:hypothetical protein n=1 Tax=Luedemannella flava TaxID=349316 RepID=UPI0031D02FAF